jgi:hypothetical protein
MSSCFVEESVSIPGNAAAIFRNNAWPKTHQSTELQEKIKSFDS